jgi:hypothetical protein
METKTGGSDVMGESVILTASQGSESEDEGFRVCEIDFEKKISSKTGRSALAAKDQHLEPGQAVRIRRGRGGDAVRSNRKIYGTPKRTSMERI